MGKHHRKILKVVDKLQATALFILFFR